MHHVHPKIYPAVCRVHRREDQLLVERCRQLQGRLTPEAVGVPSDYSCPYNQTLAKLNRLKECTSPLEMIHTLHDAVECVMEDAKTHFAKSLRIGRKCGELVGGAGGGVCGIGWRDNGGRVVKWVWTWKKYQSISSVGIDIKFLSFLCRTRVTRFGWPHCTTGEWRYSWNYLTPGGIHVHTHTHTHTQATIIVQSECSKCISYATMF